MGRKPHVWPKINFSVIFASLKYILTVAFIMRAYRDCVSSTPNRRLRSPINAIADEEVSSSSPPFSRRDTSLPYMADLSPEILHFSSSPQQLWGRPTHDSLRFMAGRCFSVYFYGYNFRYLVMASLSGICLFMLTHFNVDIIISVDNCKSFARTCSCR